MSRLLILSFSPIEGDARVLKQVREFSGDYEVTTCGFGSSPDPRVTHLQLPDGISTRPGGYLLQFRRYRASYFANRAVRAARKLLKGKKFDVIFANDLDALPSPSPSGPPRASTRICTSTTLCSTKSSRSGWTLSPRSTWSCAGGTCRARPRPPRSRGASPISTMPISG